MQSKKNWLKLFITLLIIWTFLIGGILSQGQDFVISRDIGGSSSVFSFPKSRKAPQRNVAPVRTAPVRRTQVQRVAARTKVRQQYETSARVTARREKIEIIRPEDLIPRADPNKASLALTGAAQYYFNENKIEESIEYFKEAYKLNPKNDLARLGLSDALARKGDEWLNAADSKPTVAEKFYLEAISLNAENPAAYAGLGEIYDELNQTDEAITNYEKALQIDAELSELNAPLGILYFQRGDNAKAEVFLKKAILIEPDNSQTQYFIGLIEYAKENNLDAEKAFRKSIELEPEFAEAHFYLGSTLARLNRETEAIARFTEAVRLNPKYSEAWFGLGAAYYNQEDYQKSVEAYLQTVKFKNDYAEAYINLADSYRQLADDDRTIKGRYDLLGQALNRYMMGLDSIKNDPDIARQFSDEDLGDIYSRFGYTAGERNMLASLQGLRHDWNEPIEALTKAAEIKKGALDYANLGWAYYNSAQIDLRANPDAARTKLSKAKEYLEKAKSLNPNIEVLTAIRLNLGITSIDLGDFKAAIDNLKPVADSRNDWAFADYSLGVAYFKSGDLNNAINQFKRAVGKESKYVAAWSGLGNAYLQKNDQKEVRRVIAELKKIGTGEAVNEANKLQFALSFKK